MKEMMEKFIPGLELAEAFYYEIVHPILNRRFPGLNHSAGKLHRGSDVLGFDTPQSMDHDWGPAKIDLFLSEGDSVRFEGDIKRALADELPHEYRNLPVDFIAPEIDGGRIGFTEDGPVSHRIEVTTAARFFVHYIGVNPIDGISEIEWLLIPTQNLRTITKGKVFYDGLKQLKEIQARLRWYPKDIWRYLLACQWRKIDQEEPFMARCGDVGDELGSRVVAARMVDELMRLCFLMEQQYWPYYKWFGSAFSKLECAETLTPVFHSIFSSQNWREREECISTAYLHVAEMHNQLDLTEYIEPKMGQFHSRPYQVLHSGRFVDALYSKIDSEAVLNLPRHLGGIAQYVDSTDMLERIDRCKQLHVLYEWNVQQSDAGVG